MLISFDSIEKIVVAEISGFLGFESCRFVIIVDNERSYMCSYYLSALTLRKFIVWFSQTNGQVAKWFECLTAEQNTDGSSRTLGSQLGCSLTVHPEANGYLVATLGKLKAARKGTGHPASLC